MVTIETASLLLYLPLMERRLDIKDFRFKDTSFASLMTKRIYNVLLIATRYDAFILEEDGRIDEQIFNEYTALNLRYPPRFTLVTTDKEALDEMIENHYDLIIQMPNMDNPKMFALANEIKSEYPDVPFVVLSPFSREVTKRFAKEDLSSIDFIFSWLGNSELLLAIIKLMEDSMNAEHDVESVGVQIILLVEDSIRFYSSALPTLYRIILKESKEFSKEALNEHEQMLRMRGRPKIMLARTYEEAIDIYTKYQNNILGVITDMSYMMGGQKEKLAGYELGKWIKSQDRFAPVIFTSSEVSNSKYAEKLNCVFIDKNSKSFPRDLKKQIVNNFGFGDFIIIDPQTNEEVMRIKNLKDLQEKVFSIPTDSLIYHMSNNHFSRFFYSRAMFPVAEWLKKIDISDVDNDQEARQMLYDMIIKYRRIKNSGVVAIFQKDRFDAYSNFVRIGDGSIGGKGRSIAFMDNIVKEHIELNEFEDVVIKTPKTLVLCTDLFDEFMDLNDLYPIALSEASDEDIFNAFLKSSLPEKLEDDIAAFCNVIKKPIAVRSSSLLEDSQYQPFAGVYSTYMIPFSADNDALKSQLYNAIKGVYASVFFQDSKTYMAATHNLIDQEKMAIILQETVGTQYGERFYPTISGVARSLNFYPVGNEKPEEGIANIVLGLGKHIVEGGASLRFSPYHPHNIVQLSSVDFALRDTQRFFYALNLSDDQEVTKDDGFNLLKLNTKEAEKDNSIRFISSTYNPVEQMIFDGYYEGGRKIISFANVLLHETYPLAEILKKVLKTGEQQMGRGVEIEFAVDLNEKGKGDFYLLQIRPIVQSKDLSDTILAQIKVEDTILYTTNALGHGISKDIHDIIYVKTKNFDPSINLTLVEEIEKINQEFLQRDDNYILVGPGRWGSSDQWLGIPVRWPQISNAKVLVEIGLKNYMIEPSQGTHFFQNLTSFGVGYFSINLDAADGGVFDEEYLNSQPAVYESDHLRHVHFDAPIITKISGRKKIGAIMKPGRKS